MQKVYLFLIIFEKNVTVIKCPFMENSEVPALVGLRTLWQNAAFF